MNNTEYKAYLGSLIPAFQDFTVTVNELVEDKKENKVVMWAQSTATTAIGPYANEVSMLRCLKPLFHFLLLLEIVESIF